LAGCRERPIEIQIKLGPGGEITIGGDVVADILDPVSEELTLFQLESNTVFKTNVTHTSKLIQKGRECSRPQQDVIDDDTAAQV
jgi:hypothetical protein